MEIEIKKQKRGYKSRLKPKIKALAPPTSMTNFFDQMVHQKTLRPNQYPEIRAWFLHHGLGEKEQLDTYLKILEKYSKPKQGNP